MATLKEQLLAAAFVVVDGEAYTAEATENGVLLKGVPNPNSIIEPGELAYGDEKLDQFQPDTETSELWRNSGDETLRIIPGSEDASLRLLNVQVLSDQDVMAAPTLAVVSLSPRLITRIRALAAAVAELDCCCIEDFDYSPEYYGSSDEDPSIDTCRLVVTRTDFWWEGMIKHTSVPIQTAQLAVAALNS